MLSRNPLRLGWSAAVREGRSAGETDVRSGVAASWCWGRGGRRVALGLTALAWPSVPARPWVGAAADSLAARVFGRALGARDVAMGLGALTALRRPATESG